MHPFCLAAKAAMFQEPVRMADLIMWLQPVLAFCTEKPAFCPEGNILVDDIQ